MKYKLIKQKPNYCVPRCIQTILNRHGILFDSQENIGLELGIDNNGTHIENKNYSLQKYFDNHKLPFIFEYYFVIDYNNAKKIILDNINNDIIVCYKRGVLFDKQMEGGHATLIEEVDGDVIKLLYPEDQEGYRKVTLDKLLEGIKQHGKNNMAGFWVITKK